MIETKIIKDFRTTRVSPLFVCYYLLTTLCILFFFRFSLLSLALILLNRFIIWLLFQARFCGLTTIAYVLAIIDTHMYSKREKVTKQEPVLSSNDSTRSCHIFFEGVYNLEPWQTVYFRRCLTQSLALDEIFTKLNTKISTAFQTGSYTERTFFERVSKAYEDVYSNLTTAKELLTLDSVELSMEQLNCILAENETIINDLNGLAHELEEIIVSNQYKAHHNEDIKKLIQECKYYK